MTSASVSSTSVELSFRLTRMASASRVNSSIKHSILNFFPSWVRPFDEVVGPDVVGPAGAQAHARAVVEPEVASLWLLLWDFQPLSPPDALNPLGVHRPACTAQEGVDPPIPVAAVDLGQLDDVSGQRRLIIAGAGLLALSRAVLAQDLAGPTFGNVVLRLHRLNASAATSGA